MPDEPIVLYIVLRQSLQLNADATSHCIANAIQHILLKYFTLQVLTVKTHHPLMEDRVATTTKWLSSHSKKVIINADDDLWFKVKQELGKDLFCLTDLEADYSDVETTLILWPLQDSLVPAYLKPNECI